MTEARLVQFPLRRLDGDRWEPWIDERALARYFGVSTRTVRRWRREGMPSRRVGGGRRYRISLADVWLDRMERT
jgi:excisionase family DNA binding protein